MYMHSQTLGSKAPYGSNRDTFLDSGSFHPGARLGSGPGSATGAAPAASRSLINSVAQPPQLSKASPRSSHFAPSGSGLDGGSGRRPVGRGDRSPHSANKPAGRFGVSWARRVGSLITESRSPFASFMNSYKQRKGVLGRTSAGGLFPCSLPPKMCNSQRPRSNRRAARWRRHRAADIAVRNAFAASSFVALGCPRFCPRALPRPESEAHIKATAFIRRRALQFARLMEPAGPIGSGRRGPSLKAQLEQL